MTVCESQRRYTVTRPYSLTLEHRRGARGDTEVTAGTSAPGFSASAVLEARGIKTACRRVTTVRSYGYAGRSYVQVCENDRPTPERTPVYRSFYKPPTDDSSLLTGAWCDMLH